MDIKDKRRAVASWLETQPTVYPPNRETIARSVQAGRWDDLVGQFVQGEDPERIGLAVVLSSELKRNRLP
jgi:hypothetical protein